MLDSIERSRKCSLAQFIMGLGIKYVGTETAELISDNVRDLDHLLSIKEEELLKIEGIGEKTAHTIAEYFQDSDHREEIRLLLRHGVSPHHVAKKKVTGHVFSDKTFVLTGTLEHLKRDDAAKLIKERGGHVAGSVSRKTDYVLVGADPGSKYDQAQKLGIQILSEDQFMKMLD